MSGPPWHHLSISLHTTIDITLLADKPYGTRQELCGRLDWTLIRALWVGCKPWSNTMEILDEKDGVDTELLVYAMTLLNKTLAALPDQDSFYDMVDALEEQGMEAVTQRHLGRRGTDLDLVEQLNIYEATLRHEDGDDNSQPPPTGQKDRRRTSIGSGDKKCGLERRRSRRASLGRSGHASPLSPASPQRAGFHPFGTRDASER
ncbi:unnamed protein product [Merluccius merluccius]